MTYRYPNREEIVATVKVGRSPDGRDAIIQPNPLWSESLCDDIIAYARKSKILRSTMPAIQALHLVKAGVVVYLFELMDRRELVERTDGLWYRVPA